MVQKKEKKTKLVTRTTKKSKKDQDLIFVQIASYRDPQLLITLREMISNASHPENLRIGIAWQHSENDAWDKLDEFKDDPRFRIIDINYKDSKGVCWARNAVQQLYDNEKYTLQLDSHHRFVKDWDKILIEMLTDLQKEGYKKPLITAYIPSFDPDADPEKRVQEPWKMNFDRFIPEGAIFFLPASFDSFNDKNRPVRGRFYSAHFAFTLGQFCIEVPHDPNYYFHGEEISIAVRAYTHGYDIFHPHKVICWHEYTRKGRSKQWDDDPIWPQRNNEAHLRNRKLFGMDGLTNDIDFGPYGFGKQRTLADYEKYSGISFSKRAVQRYTLDHKEAPNPYDFNSEEEYQASFLKIFKHCIDVGYSQVPENDYDFWCVAFKDGNDNDIYRQDADLAEINRMKNDPDGYCKVWREFPTEVKPVKWVVWPHSISKGWCDMIQGILP
jgi:glycosyltransferase involved in cell wall biosynthesis